MKMTEHELSVFIETYRCKSHLWDTSQPYYHNKQMKQLAQEELCKILKVKDSEASLYDVKKQIDSLKYLFKREHKKFIDSIYKGTNVYKSDHWYYYKLLFLCPVEDRSLVLEHLDVSTDIFEAPQVKPEKVIPMVPEKNLDEFCLACMNKESLINIYIEPNLRMTHQSMLKDTFNIHVTSESGLGFLCPTCAHKLVTAHKFKQTIQDTVIKQAIPKLNNIIRIPDCIPSNESIEQKLEWGEEKKETPDSDNKKLSRKESLKARRELEASKKRELLEQKEKVLGGIQPGSTLCSVCGFKARTSFQLRCHVIIHYSTHVCDICGKVVASSKSLTSHRALHDSQPTRCSYCDKVFKNRSTWLQHRNYSHLEKKKVYRCKVCSTQFATFVQRVRHERVEHNVGDEYKCRFCAKTFIVSAECTRHERRFHLKERHHGCGHCGEMFWSRPYLNRHLVRVHNIGEKLPCPHCPKMFLRKYDLNVHVGTHFGTYRFCCQYCNKKFNRLKDMRTHTATHEIKPNAEQPVVSEQQPTHLHQQMQSQITQMQPQTTQMQPQTTKIQPQSTQMHQQSTPMQPQTTQMQPQTAQMQPQTAQMHQSQQVLMATSMNAMPDHGMYITSLGTE